jgi:hypothetical protein
MKTVQISRTKPASRRKPVHQSYNYPFQQDFHGQLLSPRSRENLNFLLLEAVEISKAESGGIDEQVFFLMQV